MFFHSKSPEGKSFFSKCHTQFLINSTVLFPRVSDSSLPANYFSIFSLHNAFSLLSLITLILHLLSHMYPTPSHPLTWTPVAVFDLQKLTKEGKTCTRYHHAFGDRDRLKLGGTNTAIHDKSFNCLNWILKSYGSAWNLSVIKRALIAQIICHSRSKSQYKHRQVS